MVFPNLCFLERRYEALRSPVRISCGYVNLICFHTACDFHLSETTDHVQKVEFPGHSRKDSKAATGGVLQEKAAPATLLKKEALAQVFSCEFCEISKNIFFTEHLRATASEESAFFKNHSVSKNFGNYGNMTVSENSETVKIFSQILTFIWKHWKYF